MHRGNYDRSHLADLRPKAALHPLATVRQTSVERGPKALLAKTPRSVHDALPRKSACLEAAQSHCEETGRGDEFRVLGRKEEIIGRRAGSALGGSEKWCVHVGRKA